MKDEPRQSRKWGSEWWKDRLNTPEWREFRTRILRRDGGICQQCGSRYRLQIHHFYYRDFAEPWDYPDDAVVTLCEKCHNRWHDKQNEAQLLEFRKDHERRMGELAEMRMEMGTIQQARKEDERIRVAHIAEMTRLREDAHRAEAEKAKAIARAEEDARIAEHARNLEIVRLTEELQAKQKREAHRLKLLETQAEVQARRKVLTMLAGLIALTGLAILAVTFYNRKPVSIVPSEAGLHVGRYVAVTGPISQVYLSRDGYGLLHFGGAFPDQVFSTYLSPRLVQRFTPLQVQKMEGKTCTVLGRVELNSRRLPQINLKSVDQLRMP